MGAGLRAEQGAARRARRQSHKAQRYAPIPYHVQLRLLSRASICLLSQLIPSLPPVVRAAAEEHGRQQWRGRPRREAPIHAHPRWPPPPCGLRRQRWAGGLGPRETFHWRRQCRLGDRGSPRAGAARARGDAGQGSRGSRRGGAPAEKGGGEEGAQGEEGARAQGARGAAYSQARAAALAVVGVGDAKLNLQKALAAASKLVLEAQRKIEAKSARMAEIMPADEDEVAVGRV